MDKAGCNERAAVNEKEKRIEGAFQREKETQASQKRYEAEGVKMGEGPRDPVRGSKQASGRRTSSYLRNGGQWQWPAQAQQDGSSGASTAYLDLFLQVASDSVPVPVSVPA
jgi:hypothetical protein